jgi:sialidase-1
MLRKMTLRRSGDEGVFMYRIPGLTTTKSGALVASFDVRYKSGADLPAEIDVAVMRSEDDGETWSPMTIALAFNKSAEGAKGNGVGDACIVSDLETGTIWVAGLWSFGDKNWTTSRPGFLPEETGQFVLARSDDDGKTWNGPINLTRQIKREEWHLVLPGPGRGIQLTDGTLVMPAQQGKRGATHSFFIFSEDHGETWKSSPPAIADADPLTTECQSVELNDGSILLSMRNHDERKERAWAIFRRGPNGKLESGAWEPMWYAVDDSRCQGSIVRVGDVLLFSNPADKESRLRMTVRMSEDEGRSWSQGRILHEGGCGYSCMTTLPDDTVAILYETGEPRQSKDPKLTKPRWITETKALEFARFDLDWVRGQ